MTGPSTGPAAGPTTSSAGLGWTGLSGLGWAGSPGSAGLFAGTLASEAVILAATPCLTPPDPQVFQRARGVEMEP